MTRFDTQVQLEFAVDSVDAFLVPFEAFHVAQVQDAQAEAPVALIVRQPYQLVGNEVVFRVQLRFVSVAGLANAKCVARQLDRG